MNSVSSTTPTASPAPAATAAPVFMLNLFNLPATEAQLLGSPRQMFDTFDELADAGRTVD